MRFSWGVFGLAFFLNLILALPVPFILGLGFFVRATKYYSYFYDVLTFPSFFYERFFGPIKGLAPLVIIAVFGSLFWGVMISFAYASLAHRKGR